MPDNAHNSFNRRSADAQIATISEKVHNIEKIMIEFKTDVKDTCKERGQKIDILESHVSDKHNRKDFNMFIEKKFEPLSKNVFRHVIYWGIMILVLGFLVAIRHQEIFKFIGGY